MKLFLTLLLSYSFFFAFSQVYTSSCIATPQMENIYRNDVVKTATHRLFEINSSYKDSIDVPDSFKDSIAKAFYAIYNMPGSSLKDTILNLFAFQNYTTAYGPNYLESDSLHIYHNGNDLLFNFSPKSVNMSVPDTTIWAIQWQSGNYSNTVNPKINQLVIQYGINVLGVTHFSTYFYIGYRANCAVNTFGLSKAFNNIIGNLPYSYACKPANFVGDGNSIQLNYQSIDGIIITYTNSCGDCPAGCTHGRSWKFKVYYANCDVEYLGAVNYGTGTNPYNPNLSVYTCTRGAVILSAEFNSITGYLQNGKAALNWKVLAQINVKEYVVERSDNGQQFYATGQVAATNALTAEYTWKDAALLTGTAWYRIKAVDLDGKSKYSSIVKITGASKTNSFTVYPNPVVNRTFTIQFGTSASGQMNANLYSADGKKVWAATLSLTPQTVSRTLALPPAIQPGIYALVVENNNGSYRQTLVIPD